MAGDKPSELGLRAAEESELHPKTEHYVVSGLWGASWLNLAVVCLLVATFRLWSRPLHSNFRPVVHPALPGRRTVFLLCVASLVLAAHAVPRLNHSLWFDEEYSMRRSVFEDYDRKSVEDSGLTHHQVKWSDTFWSYEKPNNHVGFSILARPRSQCCAAPHRRGGEFRFREPLLRLPAFFAGIACLFGIASLFHYLKMPAAGTLAALSARLSPLVHSIRL